MGPDRYLELLAQDGALLSSAARTAELDAPIATCPGWTVRDCVAHTADVYQHKVAWIRLGHRPGEGDYESEPPGGLDVLGWFDASLALLTAELRARDPAAPASSWWPADQTVGFWYRRMAQETAVHRVDVQDAAGEATPIDAELALDGIDEVLERFLGDDWGAMPPEEWGDVDPHAGEGRTTAVRSGATVWRATLGPERIALDRGEGPADATVSGAPEDVLLWLWGRRPDSAVTLGGNPPALAAFRDRLVIATQ